MSTTPSHNIYETRRKPTSAGEFVSPGKTEAMDIFIRDMMLQHRRQTIVLYCVATLAVLLLVGMISFWLSKTRGPQLLPQSAAATNVAEMSYALRRGETPPPYLIDWLKQIKPQALPTNAPAEWTAEWIKQTVYHLLQGEKAASEERFETALAEYQKALQIHPNLKGVHKLIGLIYLQQKKYQDAVKEFELVSQEEPTSFGVINNISIAYLGLGNMEKAEGYLLETIKLEPNYAIAYYNLAMLYQKQNDLPRAADYLNHYTQLKPEDLPALEIEALLYLQLQKWDQAMTALAILSQAMPQNSVILFRLAQAQSHLEGRQETALDTLERAINLVDSRKALGWLNRNDFDALRQQPRFKKLLDDLSIKDKP